ncbi:MAG: hypothetical protein HQ483_03640 [Rhodospirillales bacterium]|nr:hypothetical protein [Rhodospirillales bacterium]
MTSDLAAGSLDGALGKALFDRQWVPAPASTDAADGLGPLFNARSCASCHPGGGRGRFTEDRNGQITGNGLVARLGDSAGTEDPTYGSQLQTSGAAGQTGEGRLLRRADGNLEIKDFGYGKLHPATRFGGRLAPSLHGLGLIALIADADILQWADPEDSNRDGISGRANFVADTQGNQALGRFGWKAGHADLTALTASALSLDLGLSNPLAQDPHGDCTAAQTACRAAPHGASQRFQGLEVSSDMLAFIVTYISTLQPPPRRPLEPPALARFTGIGCAQCHRPQIPLPAGGQVAAFSDFLIHDMGPHLADGIGDHQATGREWRTAPLWGIREASRFLHDGRATTLRQAIALHGGEAAPSRDAFLNLSAENQDQLLNWLSQL